MIYKTCIFYLSETTDNNQAKNGDMDRNNATNENPGKDAGATKNGKKEKSSRCCFYRGYTVNLCKRPPVLRDNLF